jgi:cephalosporin hydroxylase
MTINAGKLVKLSYKNITDAVDSFHEFYEMNKLWEKTTWLGQQMWKLPFDAIVLQEIIYATKPDLVIETGTGMGGSALFYASILHLLDNGMVLTIDEKRKFHNFGDTTAANRINFIEGSSIADKTLEHVRRIASGRRCMVILDSWHTFEHVQKELEAYKEFVSLGCYMVVEDTHVNGHPVQWEWGAGPYEAVQHFIEKYPGVFVVDKQRERHMMTFNPSGYLRRMI